jgi:hypothetical protein
MHAALPAATPAILTAPGSLAARCSSQIRLAGERLTVNRDTGEIVERFASTDAPFGVVLLACGNRRASRCQSCSDVYRHDAYALVRAGVAGDAERGVPIEVSSHPRIFAPSRHPRSARSIAASFVEHRCCPVEPDRARGRATTGGQSRVPSAMSPTTRPSVSRCALPATTTPELCSGTPMQGLCGAGPPSL